MKSFIFRNTKNGHSFRVEAASLALATAGARCIVGSFAFEWIATL